MSSNEVQIENFISEFSSELAALTRELRTYLKKETKPTFELVGNSRLSLNIGYGFTKKPWDCYCAIIVYSKHINISFPSGSALPDPNHLLKGTGKRIRHIRVSTVKELGSPENRALLDTARSHALLVIDQDISLQTEIKTLVKKPN